MIDRKRLRELAAKATPGPWKAERYQEDSIYFDVRTIDGFTVVGEIGSLEDNAAYIAACSPDVILELLDELDSLAELADSLDADLSAARSRED